MEAEELRAHRDEEFRELQAQNRRLQQELEAATQVGAHGGGHPWALGVPGGAPWGAGGVLGVPHGVVGGPVGFPGGTGGLLEGTSWCQMSWGAPWGAARTLYDIWGGEWGHSSSPLWPHEVL